MGILWDDPLEGVCFKEGRLGEPDRGGSGNGEVGAEDKEDREGVGDIERVRPVTMVGREGLR
jgi:hypothetical protein